MDKEARKVVWARYQKPKATLWRRYPRFFSLTTTFLGITILFSKPLYDMFIVPGIDPLDDKK